ncbi:MAG TPA: hypothetical protein VF545_12685 [Thermoleophilaceae bacterium]
MNDQGGGEAGWERFAAEIAQIAEVPSTEVGPEARIVEDLGYDSLALAELALVLIDDYDMEALAESLGEKTWDGVTAGQLYDEYCSAAARRPDGRSELSSQG